MPRHARNGKSTTTESNGHVSHPLFERLDTCRKGEQVSWVFEGFIAQGQLNGIQGPKGVGKSTFSAWLVARYLAAERKGGRRRRRPPRAVWWGAAEESYSAFVAPRLVIAGVKPKQVLWPSCPDRLGARRLKIPEHWKEISKVLIDQNVGLVVLDPFHGFMEKGLSTCIGEHLRQALEGPMELAEQHDVTFLLLQHFNKYRAGSKLDRGIGSVELANVCRAVCQLTPDDETEGRFILERVAGNVGRKPPSRYYTLPEAGGGLAHFELGEELPPDLDDAEALAAAADRADQRSAVEMILHMLKDGEKEKKTLLDAGEREGHSSHMVKRALQKVGAVYRRDGEGKGHTTYWALCQKDLLKPRRPAAKLEVKK